MFTGSFVRFLNDTNKQINSEWIQTSFSFPTEEEAIRFILGFGNRIRVISPNYLQSKLKVQANEIIDLYNN
jgi:predicted DNA-binding transcriptional regulator YafY